MHSYVIMGMRAHVRYNANMSWGKIGGILKTYLDKSLG